MNHAPAILAASALIYSMHRLLVVWIVVAHFHLCSLLGTLCRYTALNFWAVWRPMRGCCGSRWGQCVLFTNILDSSQPIDWCIIRPCIQYTAGVASLAGAWFTHWPVRPMCGLYGPVLPQVPSVLPRFWQLWYTVWSNKSSAVAEMGDCMATIHQHYNRHRPKVGLSDRVP